MVSESRTKARVDLLTRLHGVHVKNVMGAYDTQPLRSLEFLFHEVSHWLTLGNPIEKVPRRLSVKIDTVLSKIPSASTDSLEIDTALVTFLAGYQLGLWIDPSPIVKSCRRNLRGIEALGQDFVVLSRFQSRYRSSGSASFYDDLAAKLAKWFRPSAKLLPTTSVQFGV